MEILKVDTNNPEENSIEKIVKTIDAGKMVVLPTETVYTFATDATNEKSVELVFQLKGRDFNKPLHVVVDDIETAAKYVFVNQEALTLAEKFLPGPLTLVLPKKEGVLPAALTAGLPTLGIRIPALPLNLEVAKRLGKPYTTTSANLSGGPNPYSIEQVLSQFPGDNRKTLELIVDVGPLPNLPPSTLIDLTQFPPKIIRSGPVSKERLEEALGLTILGEQ